MNRLPWMLLPALGLFFLARCGTSLLGGDAVARAEATPSRPPAAARKLFLAKCQKCHDADGTGREGRDTFPKIPDFTNPRWQRQRSNVQLAVSIQEGKGTQMPPFGKKLTSGQVRGLVAFIRSLGPKGGKTMPVSQPMPSPSAARLFQSRCVRCHDADGRGSETRDTAPEIPDFTRPDWHKQRSNTQLVVSILEGKGARMPAFAGKISEAEARELASHVRSFASGQLQEVTQEGDDFEERFRQLQEEYEQLRKQLQELKSGRKK